MSSRRQQFIKITSAVLALLFLAALLPAVARSSEASLIAQRVGRWKTLARSYTQSQWGAAADKAVSLDFRAPARQTNKLPGISLSPVNPTLVKGHAPARTGYAIRAAGTTTERTVANHVGYTRNEILDPSVFPYVAHGRLFSIYETEQIQGVCSATIVPDDDNSLIVTAGHCLYSPELGYPDAVAFAPGYRLGVAPFGYWMATTIGVTDQWANGVDSGRPDPRFDIGLAEIAPDNEGITLGQAFGTRGIAFGFDWRQEFQSFGYPTVAPFDGERLYTCISEVGEQDGSFGSPMPTGMGCDMTQGSSGGGWVIEDQYVNSVVSYSRPDLDDEEQFGPYFGTAAEKFYKSAAGDDIPLPTPSPVETPIDDRAPKVFAVSDRPDPFSPNGDGRKDFVRIFFTVSEPGSVFITVYNRAGRKISKSPSAKVTSNVPYAFAWFGANDRMRVVKPGTYKYVLSATDAAGNVGRAKGTVTVRR